MDNNLISDHDISCICCSHLEFIVMVLFRCHFNFKTCILLSLLGFQIFLVLLYRLFTTVRDSLGLTYDVSFELNLFDRLNLGWYVISVTSTPGKVRIEFPLHVESVFSHFQSHH